MTCRQQIAAWGANQENNTYLMLSLQHQRLTIMNLKMVADKRSGKDAVGMG